MTDERWLPVVGEPGYEVSDLGRVRSLDRDVVKRNHWSGGTMVVPFRGKILKSCDLGGAKKIIYQVVGVNGRSRRVHKLVLEAFVGPCPPGMIALHGDDDPRNNRLTNLQWGTSLQNNRDAWERGRCPIGEHHGKSKLMDADIPVIRQLARRKTLAAVADLYGVSLSTIWSIKQGKTWTHIKEMAA